MKFLIASVTQDELTQVILTDPASRTQVIILPEYGAMLHAFFIATKEGMHNIIDNYSSAAEIKKDLSASFKSSKLSPFACRIPEGKYVYAGKVFELQHKFMDGTAIHGLLYNKAFIQTAASSGEQKASVVFTYNYSKEDDGYPFSYSCGIQYTLLPQNTLQVQTTVTSLDDVPIPIMDGWHPYFTLGGKVNDWQLYFGADQLVEFNDQLVPTGRLLPNHAFNTAEPVASTQLDNCFLLNYKQGYPACTLRNNSNGLQLNLFADASYPYLQIYTPAHRNSIAIENLSAAPNAFNNNMGLLLLQPRHTHSFTLHYQVNAG